MNNDDLKNILDDFSNSQGDNSPLYRNRNYKGQPHTFQGTRGKTEVKGVSFRDLSDAFVIGAMCAGNDQIKDFRKKIDGKKFCINDLYKLDWDKLDPVAVIQNMFVEVEKMMGIYPNVPNLDCNE